MLRHQANRRALGCVVSKAVIRWRGAAALRQSGPFNRPRRRSSKPAWRRNGRRGTTNSSVEHEQAQDVQAPCRGGEDAGWTVTRSRHRTGPRFVPGGSVRAPRNLSGRFRIPLTRRERDGATAEFDCGHRGDGARPNGRGESGYGRAIRRGIGAPPGAGARGQTVCADKRSAAAAVRRRGLRRLPGDPVRSEPSAVARHGPRLRGPVFPSRMAV